jgi:probable HAF family extracellular repeat protein
MRWNMAIRACAGLGAVMVSTGAAAADVTMYELGTLGGDEASAFAVSDAGHVVGTSIPAGGTTYKAFYWTEDGGMVEVIDLGGYSAADDVNDLGEVVGEAYGSSPFHRYAFYWNEDDGSTVLSTSVASAAAINNAGQVAGTVRISLGVEHAFLWTETGGLVDIGTLGGSVAMPYDINEDGVIVGKSTTSAGDNHAFRWTEDDEWEDLGTLGGTHSFAVDVSDSGMITGYSQKIDDSWHAFAYTDALGMVDVGAGDVGSKAWFVNEEGQIAGNAENTTTSGTREDPFLWSTDDGLEDLGNMGYTGASSGRPTGFNDLGMLVGQMKDSTGWYSAYLWTEDDEYESLEVPGTTSYNYALAQDINDLGWIVGYAYNYDTGAGYNTTAVLWVVDLVSTEDALDGAFEDIDDLVTAGTLTSGQGNALSTKLESAIAALDKGNTKAACNKLGAFVNQVEALVTAGTLTSTEGEALLAWVDEVDECA